MGHNKIKRLVKQESKWTDKSCVKHIHSFTAQVNVQLIGDPKRHIGKMYYYAMKCEFCNSFINASFESVPDATLPTLYFKKSHFAIGFRDIKFLHD